jgi:predicted chitinase
MGKNIKDFKSWNTVSEAGTWGEWMQSLVTGAKAEAPELGADTKSAIANVKDLAGKAADKISDIFGIDNKDDKDAKIKPGKSFKSTDGKIPEEYVAALEAAMDRHGITNDFSRKAILGVVSKESPNLKPEVDYSGTSNSRIREVFGSRVSELSDSQLNALKSNPTAFWDRVYGPTDPTGKGAKYGNSEPGDGEKYRGRGFNGITFKSNYRNLQKIYNEIGKLKTSDNIDIVVNPEQLEDPEIAAEFAILYYIDTFKRVDKKLNAYNDLESAVTDYVRATAGWGSDITSGVKAQGFNRALAYAQSLV